MSPWSLGPRQRSALISWAAFAATFAGVRAMTYAMKKGAIPVDDIHTGSDHVHRHPYWWGIKLLAGAGGVAIHGNDRMRANPMTAVGFGAGAALVVDEFALLVHLKDVYWTKNGRLSLVLGTGLIAAVGASFTVIPAWRRARVALDESGD
jgi:hypothetical protein